MSAPAGRASGAPAIATGARTRPRAWLLRHLQTLVSSLGELARSPVGTSMTAGVVGIALALPGGLYALLDNVQALSRGWDGAVRISLYLRMDAGADESRALAAELAAREDLAAVEYVSPARGLEEFRRLSGLGDVLEVFEEDNPLPPVLLLRPAGARPAPAELARLVDELSRHPLVDLARYDREWLRRLDALLGIARRGVVLLGGFLGLGVLLIVGNTIRLGIQNRRDEIEIAKLFGATDAFIRRPFLYTGLWYGLLGALLAWALVGAALALLRGPVADLAALYQSGYRLEGLDAGGALALLAAGAGLGVAGSWLAVGRHLSEIEPT